MYNWLPINRTFSVKQAKFVQFEGVPALSVPEPAWQCGQRVQHSRDMRLPGGSCVQNVQSMAARHYSLIFAHVGKPYKLFLKV